MKAENVAEKLKKARRNADGSWSACCPAHDDRSPSLTLTDSPDNDLLLWHCHAGCTQEEVRMALERAGAMEAGEQREQYQQLTAFPRHYANPRTHLYRTREGKLSFVVRRMATPDGKTFRQAHLNGSGKLISGMKGVTRLPYHLDLIHQEKFVFVVEGEQAADALMGCGYPATCNPGGAGNWTRELNEHFAGKSIFIVPDNDEPGRRHAIQVAEQLHGIAATVTIANLCGILNEKEDIVDWIASHPEHLKDIYRKAEAFPPWSPGDVIEDPDDPFNPESYTFEAWYEKKIEPRDYLMGTVMCTTSRWMIYSPTGLGKTLFCLNLVAAIAAGKPFLNWAAGRESRALYIDGEMPIETFKERVIQAGSLYGRELKVFGLNRDDEATLDHDMPPLNTDEGVIWLKHKIRKLKPDIIAFDSIMCLLGGDMKEEESWEPVKKLMKWITRQRIAQIWVHHTGHDSGRSYGTSTREWELDTILKLERPPGDDDGFILNFTKNRLRTHTNSSEFDRIHCKLGIDGWEVDQARKSPTKKGDDRANYAIHIMAAYNNLAVGVKADNIGHDGRNVVAIPISDIRRWIVRHGLIPPKVDGSDVMAENDRKVVGRAQADLIKDGRIAGNEGLIWRINERDS
jgi:hypothetical protein